MSQMCEFCIIRANAYASSKEKTGMIESIHRNAKKSLPQSGFDPLNEKKRLAPDTNIENWVTYEASR